MTMTAGTAQAASDGISWASLIGGIVGGAATVAITHFLFKIPRVHVRAMRNINWNGRTGQILDNRGIVHIANARGRPVKIEQAAFLEGNNLTADPKWKDVLPTTLKEGDTVELAFEDTPVLREMKRLRPVARDSLGRYWPRHRRFELWLRRPFKTRLAAAYHLARGHVSVNRRPFPALSRCRGLVPIRAEWSPARTPATRRRGCHRPSARSRLP